MADSPDTRPSLLVRIRDARDDQAWAQFAAVYGPLVYGYARKRGLQDHDAADLTQDVLGAVARAAPGLEYDPRRGTFRGWLFTVVQHKLLNFLASPQRRLRGTGDTTALERLHQLPAPAEDAERLWDQAYEQRLFAWAGQEVRKQVEETTWQAFWATAVEGKSAKAAAGELAMTVAAVRLAKSRVMARIKKLIRELQTE